MIRRQSRKHPFTALALASAVLIAGCGEELVGVTSDDHGPQLGTDIEELSADNGMSQNGMSQNGMSQNGMSQNGMSQNGFGTTSFKTWFNANPALSDMVMRYLAACAAAAGTTYSWTNAATGITHTWRGSLGLAPGFAAGAAPTTAEQQVLTACLAAHTNYYGRHVAIAVEGYRANGTLIPMEKNEAKVYSVREAAFFGNVMGGSGAVYSCADHAEWGLEYSSARACAFDYKGGAAPTTRCAPIVYLGSCSPYCHWRPTDMAYDTCTYGGTTYKPVSTRLLPSDVYKCGDGVCQFTESCGTGNTYDSCNADCGSCP